jgi:hypothetical protein
MFTVPLPPGANNRFQSNSCFSVLGDGLSNLSFERVGDNVTVYARISAGSVSTDSDFYLFDFFFDTNSVHVPAPFRRLTQFALSTDATGVFTSSNGALRQSVTAQTTSAYIRIDGDNRPVDSGDLRDNGPTEVLQLILRYKVV